ncbi:MAG: M1 family metallopeptidase, partial [Bacteroidetes bacterium]|nr:M1 family metallopeptidase [Bacteroidota bacterium]
MKLILPFCLFIVVLTGCVDRKDSRALNQDMAKKLNTVRDEHSFANTDEIRTKHLHLDLDVDFETKTIYGVARHKMENSGADTAIFDIKELTIQKVTLGKDKEIETTYIIGEKDELLGQPLAIKIDSSTQYINIYYQTTDKCEALDWLEPELTGGKKHPFLYSQGQAILTRSWIPIQGTPANRITYSADVRVPKDLMALMSATNPIEKNDKGEYHFEMKQPIPCYLIAIAVGDLNYQKLGENSGVYAEPGLIQSCKYEFEELPKMIESAERLFGKYRWEQYDLVVLPYSFPFGGMENPRLTFANPTLLAGDRSLVSVVAHELAHSWSGNLVTNATWNDFWLNEGFTVYIENRIMEDLYGIEVADMLALIEFQELKVEMASIGKSDNPHDTRLKLDLQGRNPDDGMTTIAYVKGAFFLKTLEQKVGRRKMDAFLNGYFKDFSFKTLTTETFENYLDEQLLSKYNFEFNTKEWLYQEGLPKNCVQIRSKRFNDIQKLADRLSKGENIFKFKNKKQTIKREDYTTQEWLAFIRRLPDTLDVKYLYLVDKTLNFKNCGNAEIMAEWFVLGIRADYKAIRPSMARFLQKVGRRKFLTPIYTELNKNATNRDFALSVFEKAKVNYHFVSRSTVAEILGVKV